MTDKHSSWYAFVYTVSQSRHGRLKPEIAIDLSDKKNKGLK